MILNSLFIYNCFVGLASKLPKQSDSSSSSSSLPLEINEAHLFYQNCLSRFLQLTNKTCNIDALKSIPFLSSSTPISDNHDTESSVNHFEKTTTTKKTKIKSHALNDDAILNEYSPVKN